MEFSIAALLSNFTSDKLVAAKVLEKKLDYQDETSLKQLYIALEVLEKIGTLIKEHGKYRRIREEGVIEAKLRCSSKGFCFAIQEAEGTEDIYIRESHLSSAWNGDRVLVKLTKEGSRRRSPEGEVQLILERANQSLLARIKQSNTSFRAVPLDDRLLFEIDLQPNGHNLAEAIDHLVHVEILRYPIAQYPPLGRVVQILGSDAEAASDVELVSCKHNLPRTFSANVLEAAAAVPNQVSKKELKQRIDLRSLLTLTFNSSALYGQPDESPLPLENAFTLEKTEAGQWQLGVHTTDIAYYVELDSPLDREGLKRGSCVYLGEKVLHLFPEAIEERCSLVPGSDRLAISVLLTLDAATGQMVEFEIQPTVIQVDHQISEQVVEAVLNNQTAATEDLASPVLEKLQQLLTLSQALQPQRSSRGSFALQLPPRSYSYYDEGVLGVLTTSESMVTALLTELIVLANQVIAEHLHALAVPAIYRVQPSPEWEDVQEMIKLANNLGVELQLTQEEVVQPADFQRFTEQFAQFPASEQVLTYLLQATLKPSVYNTNFQPFFSLALPGYTREHAPLRRYADLLLQRVLHTLFDEGRDRRTSRAKDSVNLRHSSSHGKITWNVLPPEIHQELETYLAGIIAQLNEREKEVNDAEEDLVGLQKAQLMKQRIGDVFQGIITGVQSYGFFVEIEVPDAKDRLLRVEGLVHVSSLKDDWYEYRARQQALFGRKNRAAYRLGNRVSVQVKSVDYYRQQIDLVTVNDEQMTNNQLLEELPIDNDLSGESESYFDEE
jgi:ribonuclease R